MVEVQFVWWRLWIIRMLAERSGREGRWSHYTGGGGGRRGGGWKMSKDKQ